MINPDMHLAEKIEKVPSRDGFGKGLLILGEQNKDVMSLCCDLTDPTRAAWFKEKFPDRFLEVGISEQNLVGIAAGLSSLGKIPFISSFAVFNPGRNWDQIRVSLCYSNANVKIQGSHAGITVGPDGATHQALEDIAITRVLPNMIVLVPCDAIEGKKATIASAAIKGPVYLRFGREKFPVITTVDTPFEVGRAEIYREGTDVAIIACGIMVSVALVAAEKLAIEGISAMVINNHTIKPMDIVTITNAAKKTGAVVSAEEHQITGGLGGAVAEVLAKTCAVPMEFVGVNNTFGESGEAEELMVKYGLTSNDIVAAVKAVLKRKVK